MRVSTYHSYAYAVDNLQRRQGELARSQEQLSSGKRVSRPSDDPAAAARAERALAAMARADANQRALDSSRSAMKLTESALGDAGEVMQQVREMVLTAGNASYTNVDRGVLVQSMQGLREQLLSIANRSDGVGSYLFAGQGAGSPPFIDGPGGVVYDGAAGEARVTLREPLPLAIDGRAAWLEAPNPVTGQPPLSIFATLDRVIDELHQTPAEIAAGEVAPTDSQLATSVSDALRDVDASFNHLLAVRSRTGELLNRADAVESRIADAKIGAQSERSLAEDLDMVQAISDFQNRQTGYDAALKAYSLVQRLSLFDYISR